MTAATSEANSQNTAHDTQAMPPLAGVEVPCLRGFVARTFRTESEIPYETANAFLLEYIETQAVIFQRMTGEWPDALAHIRGFWAHIEKVLPPQGSYYLVWSDAGSLVGTGALRRSNERTGEMKHLYVRPEARGTGLGRWLGEQRMRDARAMGLSLLIADTLRGNVEMPALYAKFGFEETALNPDAASLSVAPEIAARMLFFRKDL